ncbi:MAG: hypothetical protein HOD60_03130 [Candidatus Nitrosopelagicus sp.]|nr:hypothetical protein [Candidatus Nitrosopelagicus sp.]
MTESIKKSKKELTDKIQSLKSEKGKLVTKINDVTHRSGRYQKWSDTAAKASECEDLFVQSWKKFSRNSDNQNLLGQEFFLVCGKFHELIIERGRTQTSRDKMYEPLFKRLRKIDGQLPLLITELKILEKCND